jgi:hypothetical protein
MSFEVLALVCSAQAVVLSHAFVLLCKGCHCVIVVIVLFNFFHSFLLLVLFMALYCLFET